MPFIAPMLAAPMPKQPLELRLGEYVIEEKYDGHRLICEVEDATIISLFGSGKKVTAWGRYGIERITLPQHIIQSMQNFPIGIYDGELLVPGKRSYGVTELVNGPDLCYVIFDLLMLAGETTDELAYHHRRMLLERIFAQTLTGPKVALSQVTEAISMEQVKAICAGIWKLDGEGVILKRVAAPYAIGRRPSKDWIKIKQLRSALLTVTGFEGGKNGPQARVCLRDDDGNETTVKTKNNDWLAKLAERSTEYVGRRLWIEYQERTPDGNYRHPRWDRWEDE